jgi:NAD(P)H-dependent FMN reductase
MPKLLIVIASTRPGRAGLPISQWFAAEAEKHGGFDIEVADLAELNLPIYDEAVSPRMGKYAHPHTQKWSEKVASADAFVFVTPEYNYGPPPSLVNALTYLFWEWTYKPVTFVSYGGLAAGLRAVQVIKQIVTTLRMMPIADGVAIPFVAKQIQDGKFVPTPVMTDTVPFNLDELLRWTQALEPLRKEVPLRRRELPPGAPPLPPGVGPKP